VYLYNSAREMRQTEWCAMPVRQCVFGGVVDVGVCVGLLRVRLILEDGEVIDTFERL